MILVLRDDNLDNRNGCESTLSSVTFPFYDIPKPSLYTFTIYTHHQHSQIKSKEKDLALLARIPPEQYLEFERLRRANGAKAIQRNWRAVQAQRMDGEYVR